jgi:hypothetical protein
MPIDKSVISLDIILAIKIVKFYRNQVYKGLSRYQRLLVFMRKELIILLFFTGMISSCMDIEEISGTCEVYVVMDDGSVRFYEMFEDIRRNKSTGVFSYRDENGRLWSINQGEDGQWYSKSQDGLRKVVEKVVCGNNVYFEEEEEETGS